MIAVYCMGIAIAAFAAFYTIADVAIAKIQVFTIGRQFLNPTKKNTKLIVGVFAGFFLGIVLAWGTPYGGTAVMVGAGLGASVVEGMTRLLKANTENKRRQECFMLFNASEIFVQTGMAIPQALASCRDFSPLLTPSINKCLAAWPQGSEKALELLRQEIDLTEGDQLVSLLLQINQVGTKNLQNIIQSESRQLEEKRRALEKVAITRKPVFLIMYRFLPFLVLMGMGAGVLITRIFVQINGLI